MDTPRAPDGSGTRAPLSRRCEPSGSVPAHILLGTQRLTRRVKLGLAARAQDSRARAEANSRPGRIPGSRWGMGATAS